MAAADPARLDPQRLPAHIACVMDGNGRWAQARGMSRAEGHRAGVEALSDVVTGALEIGLQWLTVYSFSTENWRRPPTEVRSLIDLYEEALSTYRGELHDRGVRIRLVGRWRDSMVPKRLIRSMEGAVELTRRNRRMNFTVAFNYGGRAEIVDAVREIVRAGTVPEDVSQRTISRHLYAPEMPDPDLMVRTSGEHRTSNFLLWQLAYSELYFTDVAWPDFRREHLFEAIRSYQSRDRRFGSITDANRCD